jgi:hypothetical protein
VKIISTLRVVYNAFLGRLPPYINRNRSVNHFVILGILARVAYLLLCFPRSGTEMDGITVQEASFRGRQLLGRPVGSNLGCYYVDS